ncbi:MAG: hypothetical protein J6A84_01785 [Clostridia bacterium]|nr:hypothetical protein [Clostridia bacterium]
MDFSLFEKLLALVLSLSMFLLSSFCASASSEDTYEARKNAYRAKIMADDVTADDLLIGSWVSFYSFDIDSYEDQLDQMAAAGINFNFFPKDFGGGKMYDAAYWDHVEQMYAERNMVYLMNGDMNADSVAIGVEYANGKEHCIGYHIKDEPSGAELPAVGDQMLAYRDADPERYPFTNLLPSYAGTARLGGDYRSHVEAYIEEVGAENIGYLSHDYYAFRTNGDTKMEIFADMEVLRSVAYENGKLKTHAFPQSTAWSWARMPNINEMRWNVYAYLAYGFKALTWFNLVCPGTSDTEGERFYDSLIYRDGTIRDQKLFTEWSELNWEIRGLSSVLMNLDTVHAYHVKPDLIGVEFLPRNFFLQPGGDFENDFVVSHMESKDGKETYIMLFNKSTTKSRNCFFNIDDAEGIKRIDYFDPNTGEYVKMDISAGALQDNFLAGEGKLYRLNYTDDRVEEAENAEPSEEPTARVLPWVIGAVSAVAFSAIVVGTVAVFKRRRRNH